MRICFVNLHAYAVLAEGHDDVTVGGEEVQHALLARLLAQRGHDVSLVSCDFGQRDGEAVQGVRVHPSFRPRGGVPIVRFVHPRWTGVERALARADADLYYVSCAGALVGWTAWHARRRRRRVIFRVASDTDCDPRRLLIRRSRDRAIYEWGLRRVDAVAAQTEFQRRLLVEHYRRDATVLPMVVERPRSVPSFEERDIDVLWVANLRALKRPERLVAMARAMPGATFHMVGGEVTGEIDVAARLAQEVGRAANLVWHGRLPVHETARLFARARVFVSTSSVEGFPNTFLQAWANATPVVAHFDPYGLIR